MFLQRQTPHKSLLTFVTLPGPVPVVLTGVNVHGVLGDELHVAGGTLNQAVRRGEGWSLVFLQEMFVQGVVGGDVLLQDVETGESGVAEGACVSHPRVFLSQVPLEVLN